VPYMCWKMNKVGEVPPVQHGSWSGLSSNLAFCAFVKGEINVFERGVVVLRISGKLFEGEFHGILRLLRSCSSRLLERMRKALTGALCESRGLC
jgi:hypothetical protein